MSNLRKFSGGFVIGALLTSLSVNVTVAPYPVPIIIFLSWGALVFGFAFVAAFGK